MVPIPQKSHCADLLAVQGGRPYTLYHWTTFLRLFSGKNSAHTKYGTHVRDFISSLLLVLFVFPEVVFFVFQTWELNWEEHFWEHVTIFPRKVYDQLFRLQLTSLNLLSSGYLSGKYSNSNHLFDSLKIQHYVDSMPVKVSQVRLTLKHKLPRLWSDVNYSL